MSAFLVFAAKNWKWFGLGLLVLLLTVQTLRLGHAKHDLAQARTALIDPTSKRKWADEAMERGINLDTCTGNLMAATGKVADLSSQIEALSQAGAAKLAQAKTALSVAQKASQKAQERIQALSKPLTSADACSRVDEADRRLLETIH